MAIRSMLVSPWPPGLEVPIGRQFAAGGLTAAAVRALGSAVPGGRPAPWLAEPLISDAALISW